MNKPTLLEKALKSPKPQRTRFPVTAEHAELCVAYFEGKISIQQFADAIQKNRGNAYCIVSTILRGSVLSGMVKMSLVKRWSLQDEEKAMTK